MIAKDTADGGRRASGVLDANAHTVASVWLRFDNRVPVHSATLDTLSGDGLGERGADATAESGSRSATTLLMVRSELGRCEERGVKSISASPTPSALACFADAKR